MEGIRTEREGTKTVEFAEAWLLIRVAEEGGRGGGGAGRAEIITRQGDRNYGMIGLNRQKNSPETSTRLSVGCYEDTMQHAQTVVMF